MSTINIPKNLQNVHKIVCMGDSITQGGDPVGYVSMIRNTLHRKYPDQQMEVVNKGISGQRSNDMLSRFQHDVIEEHPEVLTLNVGINDVWHGFYGDPDGNAPGGIPLDQYTVNVTSMVKSAQDHGIKVILISPTVITEDPHDVQNIKLDKYVKAESEIAKKFGCEFVDLHHAFYRELQIARRKLSHRKLYLTVDGVHMDGDGNRIMANEILKHLGVDTHGLADLKTSF